MNEIAVHALLNQRGAVTGHAIDHHALYIVLLDSFHDGCEMDVDVQLLRALEQHMDKTGVDLLLQVQANRLGVADNLGRVLIQRNQQSTLLLLYRTLQQNLRAKYGFSHTGKPSHQGGGPIEDSAAEELIQRLHTDDGAPGGRRGLCQIEVERSLNPSEHLHALAVLDAQGVFTGLIVLTAAFNDLKCAPYPALVRIPLQQD